MVEDMNDKLLDEVIKLENLVWAKGVRADKNKFKSRLKIFPEGFFLAYNQNKLIGVSTSEIIKYNTSNFSSSWEKITDNGYILTHNPKGNALYVVSIGAISRSGGGSFLINAQKNLAKKLDLKFLVLGSRIPYYNSYCLKRGEINVEDYVFLRRNNGELFDPELRFYVRNGLKITQVISDYMKDDKESRNYGVIMVWENK